MFTFTYFGYAAVLVHFEKRILIDPGIVKGKPLVDPEKVHPSYVLVSHTPIEHLGNALEFSKTKGSVIFGNSQVCELLKNKGIHGYSIDQIVDKKPMNIGVNIRITGYNLRRRGILAPQNTAFLVQSDQGCLLHLGHAKEYASLKELKPDLLCVPVAGKKKGTLHPKEAVAATLAIHPRYVLPLSGNAQQNNEFLALLNEEKADITPVQLPLGQTFTLL